MFVVFEIANLLVHCHAKYKNLQGPTAHILHTCARANGRTSLLSKVKLRAHNPIERVS